MLLTIRGRSNHHPRSRHPLISRRLSTVVHKSAHVFFGGSGSETEREIRGRAQLVEQGGKIAPSERPRERLGDSLVVVLERQQSLLDGGQRREVVGRKHLALNDGEVDLDLVEPTGEHWTMNGNQAWKLLLESSDALGAAMRGAIVHDPKDATRLVVRRLAHDLIDQSFERSDTALALA